MATFMNLPRELRNQVYCYLWRDTPRIRLGPGPDTKIDLIAIYEHPPHEAINITIRLDPLPKWFLTSKAFLREGVRELNFRGLVALFVSHPVEYAAHSHVVLPPHLARKLHITTYPLEDVAVDHHDRTSPQPKTISRYEVAKSISAYMSCLMQRMAIYRKTQFLTIHLIVLDASGLPHRINLEGLHLPTVLVYRLRRLEFIIGARSPGDVRVGEHIELSCFVDFEDSGIALAHRARRVETENWQRAGWSYDRLRITFE